MRTAPTEPPSSDPADLHMLVMLGGKKRTAAEWRSLLAEAGLELHRITDDALIEARPT